MTTISHPRRHFRIRGCGGGELNVRIAIETQQAWRSRQPVVQHGLYQGILP
jgi:hypothetical protein